MKTTYTYVLATDTPALSYSMVVRMTDTIALQSNREIRKSDPLGTAAYWVGWQEVFITDPLETGDYTFWYDKKPLGKETPIELDILPLPACWPTSTGGNDQGSPAS